MKKLLLLVFIFIVKSAFAQKDTVGLNLPYANGTLAYEKVFNTVGQPKNLLYVNAQLWFIEHYKGDRSIVTQDSILMRIVGKGIQQVTFKGPMDVDATVNEKVMLQIDCKDGRYRCRIFNISLETQEAAVKDRQIINADDLISSLTGGSASTILNKNQSRRALQCINASVENILVSLNKTMADKNDF